MMAEERQSHADGGRMCEALRVATEIQNDLLLSRGDDFAPERGDKFHQGSIWSSESSPSTECTTSPTSASAVDASHAYLEPLCTSIPGGGAHGDNPIQYNTTIQQLHTVTSILENEQSPYSTEIRCRENLGQGVIGELRENFGGLESSSTHSNRPSRRRGEEMIVRGIFDHMGGEQHIFNQFSPHIRGEDYTNEGHHQGSRSGDRGRGAYEYSCDERQIGAGGHEAYDSRTTPTNAHSNNIRSPPSTGISFYHSPKGTLANSHHSSSTHSHHTHGHGVSPNTNTNTHHGHGGGLSSTNRLKKSLSGPLISLYSPSSYHNRTPTSKRSNSREMTPPQQQRNQNRGSMTLYQRPAGGGGGGGNGERRRDADIIAAGSFGRGAQPAQHGYGKNSMYSHPPYLPRAPTQAQNHHLPGKYDPMTNHPNQNQNGHDPLLQGADVTTNSMMSISHPPHAYMKANPGISVPQLRQAGGGNDKTATNSGGIVRDGATRRSSTNRVDSQGQQQQQHNRYLDPQAVVFIPKESQSMRTEDNFSFDSGDPQGGTVTPASYAGNQGIHPPINRPPPPPDFDNIPHSMASFIPPPDHVLSRINKQPTTKSSALRQQQQQQQKHALQQQHAQQKQHAQQHQHAQHAQQHALQKYGKLLQPRAKVEGSEHEHDDDDGSRLLPLYPPPPLMEADDFVPGHLHENGRPCAEGAESHPIVDEKMVGHGNNNVLKRHRIPDTNNTTREPVIKASPSDRGCLDEGVDHNNEGDGLVTNANHESKSAGKQYYHDLRSRGQKILERMNTLQLFGTAEPPGRPPPGYEAKLNPEAPEFVSIPISDRIASRAPTCTPTTGLPSVGPPPGLETPALVCQKPSGINNNIDEDMSGNYMSQITTQASNANANGTWREVRKITRPPPGIEPLTSSSPYSMPSSKSAQGHCIETASELTPESRVKIANQVCKLELPSTVLDFLYDDADPKETRYSSHDIMGNDWGDRPEVETTTGPSIGSSQAGNGDGRKALLSTSSIWAQTARSENRPFGFGPFNEPDIGITEYSAGPKKEPIGIASSTPYTALFSNPVDDIWRNY